MRILITGGQGQLGSAIARNNSGHQIDPMGREELDIKDPACADRIAAFEPNVVVHAAAMTDVDGCERDPDEAYRVNALGARNVALGAARAKADLVYISTDFVFDGKKGEAYWEFDAPNPLSVYGASKLEGERLVQRVHQRCYIVRTAWLYGIGGKSFVGQMLDRAETHESLRVVDNEVGNPTFCDDLAAALLDLIRTGAFGTYHLVNEGSCSRHALTCAALAAAGRPDFPVEAVDHYPRLAAPPTYAPLRNFAAAELGIVLPTWEEGLERFVAAYLKRKQPAAS